jgi:ankyrin repeat protein
MIILKKFNKFLFIGLLQLFFNVTVFAAMQCQTDSIQLRTNSNTIAYVNEAYECFGYFNRDTQKNNGDTCLTFQAANNQLALISKNTNNDVRLIGGRGLVVTLNNQKYVISEFFRVGSPFFIQDIEVFNSKTYSDLRKTIKVTSMSSQSLVDKGNLNINFSDNSYLSLPQMKNLTLKFFQCN